MRLVGDLTRQDGRTCDEVCCFRVGGSPLQMTFLCLIKLVKGHAMVHDGGPALYMCMHICTHDVAEKST